MPDNVEDTSKSTDTMVLPRYMGIPTFMRTPIIEDPAEFDIAIIGVPYDSGVTIRPGSRFGPREIRNASSTVRAIHHVSRINPFQLSRVGDGGDVPFMNIFDSSAAHDAISHHVKRFWTAGTIPLSVGGDHSITLPILRAITADKPYALIHFDAHTDTHNEMFGSKYCHGTWVRRAVEQRLIDPHHTIQIGIRGTQNTPDCWDYSLDQGMRVIFMEEFQELGIHGVIREIRDIIEDHPTYISFDIDCLDPAYAPGTGTPEIGGLTTREAQAIVRGLRGSNLVAGDVVEVAPVYDTARITALAGVTMLFEILCLLAEGKGLESQ